MIEKKERLKEFVITTLLGGFLVILPIAILLVVLNWIFSIITGLIEPITSLFTFGGRINEFLANLIAIVIILLTCFSVGLLVRTAFGNYLYQEFDKRVLARIPFYKSIRETIALFSNKEKMPFRTVVSVDVYNNDSRMTGFITDTHENGMLTVFVPTGPNPTNGMIYHVPPEKVEILDVSIDDAMKSIIGMGAGSAVVLGSPRKSKSGKGDKST